MDAMRVRVAAACLVLSTLAAACGGQETRTAPPLPRCEPAGLIGIGESIPLDCRFERLDGTVFRLGDLVEERPLVLNFWASWCTFCIAEMPDFQRVYADLSDRVGFLGMDLLGVDGETRAAAERFAERTGVGYPLAYDPGGLLYAHFAQRQIMPVTILVRRGGVVAHRRFGPLDERQLRALLAEHLGIR